MSSWSPKYAYCNLDEKVLLISFLLPTKTSLRFLPVCCLPAISSTRSLARLLLSPSIKCNLCLVCTVSVFLYLFYAIYLWNANCVAGLCRTRMISNP